MRLRPIKREFFRAATTGAVCSLKIRPTMGSLRSDYFQESLARNLECYPWGIVAQFDMLPMQATEERRCRPRGIITVKSLNRHKGKDEIDPLPRDKSQSAQAELGFFPGNNSYLPRQGIKPASRHSARASLRLQSFYQELALPSLQRTKRWWLP